MRRITTAQLTFAAMFAALAVVLSVYPFTFYLTQSIRITFREVPIYLCSVTLGPVLGGICSFIADLCGTFISGSGNAWNPLFALSAVLIGVIPGLLFKIFEPLVKRIPATIISVAATNGTVSVFLTPLWLHILGMDGGVSYWMLVLTRLPLIAVMTVLQIVVIILLTPVIRRVTEGKRTE